MSPSSASTDIVGIGLVEPTEYSALVPPGTKVLVVDGDLEILATTSKMLQMLGYEVFTAKSLSEALSIVKEKKDGLDLILTEVHFPEEGVDKNEILAKFEDQCTLPVVIVTTDDDENAMLEALSKGAALYLVKPISKDDVQDLWQFAFMNKIDKIKGMAQENIDFDDDLSHEDDLSDEDTDGGASVNGKNQSLMKLETQQFEHMEQKEGGASDVVLRKRHKMVWTDKLHDRFLEAIKAIGIKEAHPKKILEQMNVPGLKKGSISSHLQKYRRTLQQEEQDAIRTPTNIEPHYPTYQPERYNPFSEWPSQVANSFSKSRSSFELNHNASMSAPSLGSAGDRTQDQWYYLNNSNQASNPVDWQFPMPSNELSANPGGSVDVGREFTRTSIIRGTENAINGSAKQRVYDQSTLAPTSSGGLVTPQWQGHW